jgi:hypothetical protein
MFGEFGVRVPFVAHLERNNATIVGIVADVDRWEAFLSDCFSMSAIFNYRYRDYTGLTMRWRVGPSVWIGTDVPGGSKVLLDYSGQLGYEATAVAAWVGLTGRLVLVERALQQLGAAVVLGGGRVRPGASIRMPLDRDTRHLLELVFGLNLTIELR